MTGCHPRISNDNSANQTRVLEVRNLKVEFPATPRDITAVKAVSFSVNRGEVLAVVGESGSGKSVSALAIMGLLPASAKVQGSVLLNGDELLGKSARMMREIRGRRIALVPQDPISSLNPVYKIGAQLAEAIRAHGRASDCEVRKRSIELLDAMGVPEARSRLAAYPHQLSGGLRQRVVIAMAIANNPDLIIADEATTALDVSVQAQVLDSLMHAQRVSGASILLITHDLGIVAGRADRAVVMKDGEVVEEGAVDQIFYSPMKEYTRKLINSMPKRPAILLGHKTDQNEKDGSGSLREVDELPIISMQSLNKKYTIGKKFFHHEGKDTITALDDVSIDLMPGKTIGIVGESGSGKTTLIRTLFGLESLSSGTILFEGRDTRAPVAGRRSMRGRMQMVFQDPYASLDPMMTVLESLIEPAIINGVPRDLATEKAGAMLARVGLLPEHAARYPNEFSGGQRQRIAIARALMLNPTVIALDEPVAALDMTIQSEVLELLKSVQKEFRVAYLMISHDLSVISSIADDVVVMKSGRIIERGSVAEIFLRPKHDYTKKLLAAIPIPDPRLERARQKELRERANFSIGQSSHAPKSAALAPTEAPAENVKGACR